MNDDTDKLTDDSGRKPDGTFAPGNALGGSRQGRANKIGVTVKVDLLEAYEQKGGVEYLMKLPDSLFVPLLAKLLPRDQKVEIEGGVGMRRLIILKFGDSGKIAGEDVPADQQGLQELPDDGEAHPPSLT